MKVLQVNKLYPPDIGGVENIVKDIATHLAGRTCMRVLCARKSGPAVTERHGQVEIIRAASAGMGFSMPIAPFFPLWFSRYARGCDIVHMHLPFPLGVFALLPDRGSSYKLVVSWHSDIIRQRWFLPVFDPFLLKFLRRTDTIIVSSPQLMQSSPYLRRYAHKCRVIPFGIDAGYYTDDPRKEDRLNLSALYPDGYVLFVGRFVYYKGLEYLLEALRSFRGHLVLIGAGPLKSRLKTFVKAHGLAGRVRFLTPQRRDELREYYRHCRFLVLPSVELSEAFGIVQLEAMACGKPVISTKLPTGVSYVNRHNETGLIVPPRNAGALSDAMTFLWQRRDVCESLGRFARKRVEKEFTVERMTESIYSLYEELTAD